MHACKLCALQVTYIPIYVSSAPVYMQDLLTSN